MKSTGSITDFRSEGKLTLRCLFIILILFAMQQVIAQNLVTNPGFEQYKTCPEKHTNKLVTGYQFVPRWYTVSDASPDYFNACSKNEQVWVPKNFAGNMKTRSGNGYIGLILKCDPIYYPADENYTEHIQNRLVSTLKKDKYYCFEIWICLGKNATIAARDFGIYFSKERINFPNPPDTLPQAHIAYQGDDFLAVSNRWVPLRGLYKAQGGEKYMTIGNFLPWLPGRFERLRTSFLSQDLREFAYYLFDDVSLVEVKDTTKCNCNMFTLPPLPVSVVKEVILLEEVPDNEFELVNVGESFVLQNIFFDFDKSDLLAASYPELNKLVSLLKKYPGMKVEIAGHTDYMGSIEYNMKLSSDRANAVVKYLISQGIETERLTWKGYGKARPIADNTTEEGRRINRRVEFTVLSK